MADVYSTTDVLNEKCIDLTGQKYGRLTVLKRAPNDSHGTAQWLCRCDCGNLKTVRGVNLRSGNTKSCGCLNKELASKRMTTHGMCDSRLHNIWGNMKERCQNPNVLAFKNYGDRGITVCDEWQIFEPFYEWAMSHGYREGLQIDRIDNDKGYSPDNCRWVTSKQNTNNCRSNKVIEYRGEIHTLSEWSEILKINYKTLCGRLYSGWSIERAFTTGGNDE